MQFKTRTLSSDGTPQDEVHEGPGEYDVRERLQASGKIVLSVRPVSAGWGWHDHRAARERQLIFCEQLQTLLAAGISVPESVLALRDGERDERFRNILTAVLSDIVAGRPLSAALENHPTVFSFVLCAMLRSAEKTGSLSDSLGRYAAFQRQFETFRENLWAAATYPLLLLGAGSCVLLFLMLYVVPRFSMVYKDMHGPVPWTAQLLLAWGDFANGRAISILVCVSAMILLVLLLLNQPNSRQWIGQRIDQWPLIGPLLLEIRLAHYFHSLSLLLTAGIPLSRALELSCSLLALSMQDSARRVSLAVSQGQRLSISLEQNDLLTPVALRLLQAGERSGQLAKMLGEAAEFHDRGVLRATTIWSRLAGPVLMALMGLLIGGIVVLLYLPIFQLADGLV